MVEVSLLELVSTPGCRRLWPGEFEALLFNLQTDGLRSAAAWSAVADWCSDHEEHSLAAAFAWVANRIDAIEPEAMYTRWSLGGLPKELNPNGPDPEGTTRETLAGAVAILAKHLERLKALLS